MKITFFELEGWQREYLKKNLRKHKLIFINEALSERNLRKAKGSEAIVVFIHSKIGEGIISKLPNLKFIATMSTGFDHIDLKETGKRGIKVSNVPFYGENTVAEHTFALILALSRKIFDSIERTREGDFDLSGLRGFDLKGKTLGVVGAGHIGEHVIRMAKGFEMKVLATNLNKDMKLAKKMGFKYTGLNTLLKNSDVVSLHLPLNKYTHHIINRSNIGLMKKNALLINTARGGLIETGALVKALKRKKIAGVALDVLEEEEFIKEEAELLSKKFFEGHNLKTVIQNHILMQQDNVIITPHNAFNSNEALHRILDSTIENILAFSKGKQRNFCG